MFGWRKYAVAKDEAAQAAKSLAVAHSMERRTLAIRDSAAQVGGSLRALREKNHFIETITHTVGGRP